MKVRTVVLLAGLSALWLIGLIGQLHSPKPRMRYLVLSLAIVAIGALAHAGEAGGCAGSFATESGRRTGTESRPRRHASTFRDRLILERYT